MTSMLPGVDTSDEALVFLGQLCLHILSLFAGFYMIVQYSCGGKQYHRYPMGIYVWFAWSSWFRELFCLTARTVDIVNLTTSLDLAGKSYYLCFFSVTIGDFLVFAQTSWNIVYFINMIAMIWYLSSWPAVRWTLTGHIVAWILTIVCIGIYVLMMYLHRSDSMVVSTGLNCSQRIHHPSSVYYTYAALVCFLSFVVVVAGVLRLCCGNMHQARATFLRLAYCACVGLFHILPISAWFMVYEDDARSHSSLELMLNECCQSLVTVFTWWMWVLELRLMRQHNSAVGHTMYDRCCFGPDEYEVRKYRSVLSRRGRMDYNECINTLLLDTRVRVIGDVVASMDECLRGGNTSEKTPRTGVVAQRTSSSNALPGVNESLVEPLIAADSQPPMHPTEEPVLGEEYSDDGVEHEQMDQGSRVVSCKILYAAERHLDEINTAISEQKAECRNRGEQSFLRRLVIKEDGSGVFTLPTPRGNFLIKSLRRSEHKTVLSFVKSWERQTNNGESPSLIIPPVAVFSLVLKGGVKMNVAMYNNAFEGIPENWIRGRYDLKGSWIRRDRHTSVEEVSQRVYTLDSMEGNGQTRVESPEACRSHRRTASDTVCVHGWDLDFARNVGRVYLRREDKQRIMATLSKDLSLLRAHNLMDYRLMIGIIVVENDSDIRENPSLQARRAVCQRSGNEFVFSLVDCLQPYNTFKKVEFAMNTFCFCKGVGSSCASPEKYEWRLFGSIDRILVLE